MPNSVRCRRSVAGWVAACVAACLAGHAAEPSADPLAPPVEPIVRHATSSPDGSAAFTFVPADLAGDTRHLPIGVFDSGIGGLTVLEAILAADDFDNRTLEPRPDGRPDFAGERFVYLGDQANMPYGNYPREGNEAFLRELILKDAVFLLGRRFWPAADAAEPALDKPPVKAIVIACNTATAYGIDDLRAAIGRWRVPVPVVGVVEAGARGVLQSDRSATRRDEAVAVLATIGTCASNAYPQAIAATFGRAGRRAPEVVQRGFADLAAAVEGDPAVLARTSVERTIAADLRELLDERRRTAADRPVGTIVLGCTHFPLVRRQIVDELERLRRVEEDGGRPYEPLIAEEIEVVDPASLTAKELFRTLALERLRADPLPGGAAAGHASPSARAFISVAASSDERGGGSERGARVATFRRPVGRLDAEDTPVVTLTADLLPATSLSLIRSRLPTVWRSFGW